jgi:hypothetical protein
VNADPQLVQYGNIIFGRNMWSIARAFLGLAVGDRNAWIRSNPQLWALLQKFMLWLLALKPGATLTASGDALRSIPGNVTPIPGEAIPPNAPFVPPIPAVPAL